MKIRVRLFASLRETAGTGEARLELPPGSTPDDAWACLVALHPALAPRRASLTAAVIRRYADFRSVLADGDEVVFIPPVSGG